MIIHGIMEREVRLNTSIEYGHTPTTKAGNGIMQFLSCRVNDETYGLEIHRVKEILEFKGCTRMPMVPDFIRGVINLRGHVVPVMDMRRFFFEKESDITRWSCVVIVEGEEAGDTQYTGILVDSVHQVIEVAAENLESPPDFGTSVSPGFIDYLGKVGDEFIIVLNMDALLSYSEIGVEQRTAIASGS